MITGIGLGAERKRAITAESTNASAISIETARAMAAEALNASNISAMTRNNAGNRNSIFYGDYLGTAVTNAQWAEISAGTFGGLHLGDYWTIGGVNYRIAAFDYYLNSGDCTTHHVVIVPDTCL